MRHIKLRQRIVLLFTRVNRADGQLLMELLIALLVAGILIGTISVGLVSMIRYNFENTGGQTAAILTKDLMNMLDSFLYSSDNLSYLDQESSSHYYFIPSASSSLAVLGEESVFFNDVLDDLFLYWKFDEDTSITTPYDSSGSGITGDSHSSQKTSSCVAGNCFVFDGLSDHYVLATTTPFPLEDFSISLWAYASTSAGTIFDYVNSTTSASALRLSINGDALVARIVSMPGSIVTTCTTTQTNLLNQWNHVVVAKNETTTLLYINGVLAQTCLLASSSVATSTVLTLGASNAPLGNYFSGNLDEMRLYNRAISSDEVATIYSHKPYKRYFYVERGFRDAFGNVTSSGVLDSSLARVSAVTVWENNRTALVTRYFTRHDEVATVQNNWFGGPTLSTSMLITSPTSAFVTSSNMFYEKALMLTTSTATGTLESGIFDTGVAQGAGFNGLLWQGSVGVSSPTVYVAWANYPGQLESPDYVFSCSSASTVCSLASFPTSLGRYFRYKVVIPQASTSTVSSVSVLWSR